MTDTAIPTGPDGLPDRSELLIDQRADGIVTVTLNRPDRHNAFNDTLIVELTDALRQLGRSPTVRAIVLRGAGASFSAGADLGWMQRMARNTVAENLDDALTLAELMRTLDTLPKPTIAAVHGPAIGGGVGLVACCDIALAAETAEFGLSEVRLGIVPAVISPYVIAAAGERAARRWFLTGERFDAAEAARWGLVHQVVPVDGLDAAVDRLTGQLLQGGQHAQSAAKDLVHAVRGRPIDSELIRFTAERIAQARASAEGREGITAFLEKRKPDWLKA